MMPVAAYRSLATAKSIVPPWPSPRRGFRPCANSLAIAVVALSNIVTPALAAALDRPGLAEEHLGSAVATPLQAISMIALVGLAVMLGRRLKLSFLRGAGGWWVAMFVANVTDASLGAALRTFAL